MANESHLSFEEMLRDLTHSDYLTSEEQEIEAELPVPDRLLRKSDSQKLVSKLKLSQKIGLLLFLNKEGLLSIGGKERLLYLQQKASEEALIAGIKWSTRLSKEPKLQSDFKHQMRELNRRPQSKHFRFTEKRRIGVGYRDKGSLPDHSAQPRRKAQEESFISTANLPKRMVDLVSLRAPLAFVGEDREWIDLSLILGIDFLDEKGELLPLPSPL